MNRFRLLNIPAMAALLFTSLTAGAGAPMSIVDHITAGRINTISQPAAMLVLLAPAPVVAEPLPEPVAEAEPQPAEKPASESAAAPQQQPTQTRRQVGYRVQVYSDNNARTAKNEARSRQKSISARFPNYRTYVSFNSPYWRLKVGDFKTQAEAETAAEELRKAFPASRKEIRVVRDRVNLSN